MTISYQDEFWMILTRWKGSVYKAVCKDLIAFYALYFTIMAVNWFVLDEPGKVRDICTRKISSTRL